MALLHQILGAENDLRMAAVKEEHALHTKLFQEDHDAPLALRTEKVPHSREKVKTECSCLNNFNERSENYKVKPPTTRPFKKARLSSAKRRFAHSH